MAKDHSSKTHAPVPNKPGGRGNWVEQEGHLPEYIQAIARHILADSPGFTTSRAIAAAVSQTKKRAAGGNARAIASLAQWERMKASAKARPNKGSKKVDLAVPLKGADGKVRFTDTMPAGRTIVKYGSGPSQAARATAQSKGQAFKSGRFPIRSVEDAKKAIKAFGRAKPEDKPALKRFIIRRLRALGAAHLIPKTWTKVELSSLQRNLRVIELAATRDRGIYQRHVQNTKQKGKKKGDLTRPADWEHGYVPKTEVAGALKAKHLSKADLTSTGKPKQGKEKQVDLPTPPHLQKSRTDASRANEERAREPEEVTHAEAKRAAPKKPVGAGLKSSVASLRAERSKLEKKVAAGSATAADKKRLSDVINQITRRAKPSRSNPARG